MHADDMISEIDLSCAMVTQANDVFITTGNQSKHDFTTAKSNAM